MSKVQIGSIVLVGAAVGRPVANWGLVYGVVCEIVGDAVAVTVGNANYVLHTVQAEQALVDFSWDGKSIQEMDENERSTFHNVWANTWIPMQYKAGSKWKNNRSRSRQSSYDSLDRSLPRRIEPTAAMQRAQEIYKQRDEIREQINALKGKDAALVAELMHLAE